MVVGSGSFWLVDHLDDDREPNAQRVRRRRMISTITSKL
jgi:hypothetical protein